MTFDPRACSFVSDRGAPCQNRAALKPSGAHAGALRCAWHDPGRRARVLAERAQADRKRRAVRAAVTTVSPDELPVKQINDLDDALAMARWLPIAIATGRLAGREAVALVGALREYRMTLADAGIIARLEALEGRIKVARQRGLDV